MATNDILLLDNRINVSSETSQVVPISAMNVNVTQLQCSGSAPFNNIISFNQAVTPSLQSTVLSRNLRLRYTLQIGYPSQAAAAALPPTLKFPKSTYDGSYIVDSTIRPFALQSCTDSLQLTLNGQASTISSRQVIGALSRVIPRDYLRHQASEGPCMPDQRAVLLPDFGTFSGSWSLHAFPADTTVVSVSFSNGMSGTWTAGPTYGANGTRIPVTITQNPQLKAYWVCGVAFIPDAVVEVHVDQAVSSGSAVSKYEACDGSSRGSFKAISFRQNQIDASIGSPLYGFDIFEYEIIEPLMVSPLTLHDRETFLANINTMSLQLTFSQLTDMVVMCGTVPSSAIDLSLLSVRIMSPVPMLQLEYLTVDPSVVKIPPTVIYDYTNVTPFIRSGATMALSSDTVQYQQISSDNIRLAAMPSKLYCFVRQTIASRTSVAASNYRGRVPEVFLPIGDQTSGYGGVSVNMGTKTGLFASASAKQLYRMSVSNGYNSSFEDFSFGSGAVLCIDCVKDCGINFASGDTLPGQGGSSVNFQITMGVNSANYNYVASTKAQREALGVPETAQLELVIIACYQGTCTITSDSCLFSISDLTAKNIDTLIKHGATSESSVVTSEAMTPTIKGAGLFTGKHILMGKARGSSR